MLGLVQVHSHLRRQMNCRFIMNIMRSNQTRIDNYTRQLTPHVSSEVNADLTRLWSVFFVKLFSLPFFAMCEKSDVVYAQKVI